jgi:hypothetical protein
VAPHSLVLVFREAEGYGLSRRYPDRLGSLGMKERAEIMACSAELEYIERMAS